MVERFEERNKEPVDFSEQVTNRYFPGVFLDTDNGHLDQVSIPR